MASSGWGFGGAISRRRGPMAQKGQMGGQTLTSRTHWRSDGCMKMWWMDVVSGCQFGRFWMHIRKSVVNCSSPCFAYRVSCTIIAHSQSICQAQCTSFTPLHHPIEILTGEMANPDGFSSKVGKPATAERCWSHWGRSVKRQMTITRPRLHSAWDRCKYRFHNSTAAWNAWTWPGIKEVWQCLTWATAYSVFLSVPSLHVLPSSGPHFYRLAIAQGMLQDMDIVTCGRRPWDILIISDILWQTFWTFLVLKHAKTRWVWKLDASICKTDQTDQKQITERQDWLLSHTGPCARKRFCSSKWWDMLWAERLPWLPLLVTVHCFADEQLWEAGYWMVCRNDRQMDADIIMVQMPCKWIAML